MLVTYAGKDQNEFGSSRYPRCSYGGEDIVESVVSRLHGFVSIGLECIDNDEEADEDVAECCSCFTKNTEGLCLLSTNRDVRCAGDGFGLGDWEGSGGGGDDDDE